MEKELEKVKNLLSQVKVLAGDPQFLSLIYTLVAKERKLFYAKDGDNFRRVCAEEYDDLSKRLDRTQIQESCSVRNVLRTRRLANLLIDDKGDLNIALVPKVIGHLSSHMYSLGEDRQYDAKRQEQIFQVLNLLQENKEVIRLLKAIGKPYSHKYADQIIRETLQLPNKTSVTDAHARRAALSALMCTLRQNVGSCFATAPAILVHDEQPVQFLIDINELLSTGRLKRTYGGVEYSVPLSSTWGAGDLKRNIVVSINESRFSIELWNSPGLVNALVAGGVIDSELGMKERLSLAKKLVLKELQESSENLPYISVTPEEVIKAVLLRQSGLTAKDLKEFENRPQGISDSVMMQAISFQSKVRSKSQSCINFYANFGEACRAFKGIADNALLKAWEFTLASFSEIKAQFTRWNLYSSLGLGANEKGGIGYCLYEVLQRKLEQINNEIIKLQDEYEQIYNQVKYLETRIRGASTEKEAQWTRVELQSKRNEFYSVEEMRDRASRKANRFSTLYNVLITYFDKTFPNYFQEVYDADMHDVQAGPYDDSPAGFRLLYKHGRMNTSQWTLIHTPNDFVEALVSFFTITENEIASSAEFEGFERDVSEIITAVVTHVKTQEFLESAFYRMAAAHKTSLVREPLNNLDKVDKKPWAYTSGGSMDTLVSCYFCRESNPTEATRWVENPMELLVFFIDSIKQIPQKIIQDYISSSNKSLLMTSPTHAFLLKPNLPLFKQAWSSDAFTYTQVRDTIVRPMQQFWEDIELNEEMMDFLIDKFQQQVPVNYRHLFRKVFSLLKISMSPRMFRDHILDTIEHERGLKYAGRPILSPDVIDSELYSLLPLFPSYSLHEKLKAIFHQLPLNRELLQRSLDIIGLIQDKGGLITSKGIQDISKAVLCLSIGNTSIDFDAHLSIRKVMQEEGFTARSPLIFADTNWVKDEFAFVINPGTAQCELWRMDYSGGVGAPMSQWKQWLNGSRRDISWGIYTRPYEYITHLTQKQQMKG